MGTRKAALHEGHSTVFEVEDGNGNDRQDDRCENTREHRPEALKHEDQRQARCPDRQRGADSLAALDRLGECDGLVEQAVCVHGEPEQLGQLTDKDGEREAVHVADLGRLREQVGDEAELEHAGEHRNRTDHERKCRSVRDGCLLAPVGSRERDDGCRDHRAERRVRPEDEDSGRAEHGVADQSEDRGVETGDGGQPGQLGVCHPLGDQERGDHQAGDKVLAEEGGPVRPQHRQARHRARERVQSRSRLRRHGQDRLPSARGAARRAGPS